MSDSIILAEVLPDPLQLKRYTDFVVDPGAGGIATFSGVTRDNFQGKRVLKLEYEAYAPMAQKVMQVRSSATAACVMVHILWYLRTIRDEATFTIWRRTSAGRPPPSGT